MKSNMVVFNLEYHEKFVNYWKENTPRYLHSTVSKRCVIKFMKKNLGITVKFKRHETGGKVYLHPNDAAMFILRFGDQNATDV